METTTTTAIAGGAGAATAAGAAGNVVANHSTSASSEDATATATSTNTIATAAAAAASSSEATATALVVGDNATATATAATARNDTMDMATGDDDHDDVRTVVLIKELNSTTSLDCGKNKCFMKSKSNTSIGYLLVGVPMEDENKQDRIWKRYTQAYQLSCELNQKYPDIPTLYVEEPFRISKLHSIYATKLQSIYDGVFYSKARKKSATEKQNEEIVNQYPPPPSDAQPDERFFTDGILYVQKVLVAPTRTVETIPPKLNTNETTKKPIVSTTSLLLLPPPQANSLSTPQRLPPPPEAANATETTTTTITTTTTTTTASLLLSSSSLPSATSSSRSTTTTTTASSANSSSLSSSSSPLQPQRQQESPPPIMSKLLNFKIKDSKIDLALYRLQLFFHQHVRGDYNASGNSTTTTTTIPSNTTREDVEWFFYSNLVKHLSIIQKMIKEYPRLLYDFQFLLNTQGYIYHIDLDRYFEKKKYYSIIRDLPVKVAHQRLDLMKDTIYNLL